MNYANDLGEIMMKNGIAVGALLLAACGPTPTEPSNGTGSEAAEVETLAWAQNRIEADGQKVTPLPPSFVQENPIGACKALVGVVNGRDPGIMTGKQVEDNLFHVSYRRPDDNKLWMSRCQITPDGQSMQWAQFAAFRPGEQGRWRTEDVATFTVEGSSLTVEVDQMGYAQTERYPLSKVSD